MTAVTPRSDHPWKRRICDPKPEPLAARLDRRLDVLMAAEGMCLWQRDNPPAMPDPERPEKYPPARFGPKFWADGMGKWYTQGYRGVKLVPSAMTSPALRAYRMGHEDGAATRKPTGISDE